MENPINIDDLGIPPFQETTIYSQLHSYEWTETAWFKVKVVNAAWFE